MDDTDRDKWWDDYVSGYMREHDEAWAQEHVAYHETELTGPSLVDAMKQEALELAMLERMWALS